MKKGLILLAVFMFALSGISMAAGINQINRDGHVLNYSDIALGGIMAGTTRAEVEEIYGAPTTRTEPEWSDARNDMIDTYTYGTSFHVKFIGDRAEFINTDAPNGIATPAGVTVGDPQSKILRIYGKPYRYSKAENGRETFVYRDQYHIGLAFTAQRALSLRLELSDRSDSTDVSTYI